MKIIVVTVFGAIVLSASVGLAARRAVSSHVVKGGPRVESRAAAREPAPDAIIYGFLV